ncbi:hypothetical protein [Candidatus Binatus soli]|jgi:hypothetical protein|uniref:hypothetical protein n=1 Tax=Candidatus Binatus soli TaxID=1953413 RepID=UPI003D0BB3B0
MLKFPVARLLNGVLMFQQLWAVIDGSKKVGPVPESSLSNLREMAADLRVCCEALELDAAIERIEIHLDLWPKTAKYETLSVQLRVLCETIEGQLHRRQFAFIPLDKAKLIEKIPIDWRLVLEKFSRAQTDIQAATECYALDCNTAAVFHSMRIAEHGLRALAWRLGLRQIGKQKYPLEYAEWGAILNALRGKLNALQQSPGRNNRKAEETKFYADASSHANYLNEIWRKEVSHARGPYNAPEALNALTRTRQFMELLAQRMKERPIGR